MLLDKLGKELLFFDGAMGSMLQTAGLPTGELPENWNISHPEEIKKVHAAYLAAGSDIILTNTFGANALKFPDQEQLKRVVQAAVKIAKDAVADEMSRIASSDHSDLVSRQDDARTKHKPRYVALDLGPTGKLLKPMGDLDFEEAYELFSEVVMLGKEAGVDLIHIETMNDSYELKAAVLAAKESGLPVFATTIYDEKGRLLTGASIESVVALLEGLRVDALGINCGLGPEQMIPFLAEMSSISSLPLILKPNAGLPSMVDGETVFDVDPQTFAIQMEAAIAAGACIIGGCCGTTPEHIAALYQHLQRQAPKAPTAKERSVISSYGQVVTFGGPSKIIGERLNPTGKKRLKQALKENDIDYLLQETYNQELQGAHILDVNVGMPGIDEATMMKEVITRIQAVCALPLQIDSVDEATLAKAMRIYNGKPMVNSVNGKATSMKEVFPLVAKYGGVVVCLPLDEAGIPETAEGRIAIAKRIIVEAERYGIAKKDLIFDGLAMTISAQPDGALITLDTLERFQKELGVHTILGVSNISFGLPSRPTINASFYTMALTKGLSAGIINPGSESMRAAYLSYHALYQMDEHCAAYIDAYANVATGDQNAVASTQNTAKIPSRTTSYMSLKEAIVKGMVEEAKHIVTTMIDAPPMQRTSNEQSNFALDIIETHLVPALDEVGKGFESGRLFLPQLLMSAKAAKEVFAVLKEAFPAKEGEEKGPKVLLATVLGDIHDIGKNIAKVLLENYGFDVFDLGKDVRPEDILQTIEEEQVHLVGLSALMTTTVVNMEKTIQMIKEKAPETRIMVGGAVLTQDYADSIGADFYARDALRGVHYAKEVLG